MDKLLTLLGLAFRAGKLAVGEAPVYKALTRGKAKAVVLASDAAGNTADKLGRKRGDVPVHVLSQTKAELGGALGRASCALAAVTDAGFARSLAGLTTDGGVTI